VLSRQRHAAHEPLGKMRRKAGEVYEQFRIRQDRDYISEFDRDMAKYLRGTEQ
jgi:hypothetical protein